MKFNKKSRAAFVNFLRSKYARVNGDIATKAYPYHILMDPSSCCQLSCSMCQNPQDPSRRIRPQKLMSPELYTSLLGELGNNLFMISLYNWGEPLLNPHLAEFIVLAKDYDIYVDINTNLALELSDDALVSLLSSGVDNIVVSIDGFSQETYGSYRIGGSFELARRNITRLIMLRDRLALTTTITWKFLVFSFNEHEIALAEQYCKNFGITFARKEAIIDLELHPEWLPSYRQDDLKRPYGGWPFTRSTAVELKVAGREATCAWHYCYSSINADGSVSPCCAVPDAKDDFGAVIPGIRTFADVWNNELFRASRAIMAGRGDSSEPSPICKHCPFPFLKDLSTGIDRFIIERFRELYGTLEPGLAMLFESLAAGTGFRELVDANPSLLYDAPAETAPSPPMTPGQGIVSGHGTCAVCGEQTHFILKKPGFSLREAACASCGATQRNRDLATGILRAYGLDPDGSLVGQLAGLASLDIFEAQADGPVHRVLERLPSYVCAEFLDGVTPGTTGTGGVRCENLERLTFPDATFDLVITQDVFEHIANPHTAFREITRVLKPGGHHIFTVPLHEDRATVTRARMVDGQPEYLLPPVHHGDPLRSSGSLVYTDFGDDLPDMLATLGFDTGVAARSTFYRPEELPWIDDSRSHDEYVQYRQRGELLAYLRYNSIVFCSAKISGQSPAGTGCHAAKREPTNKNQEHGQMSVDDPMAAFTRLIGLLCHENVPISVYLGAGEICYSINRFDMANELFKIATARQSINDTELCAVGRVAFAYGDHARAEHGFYKALSVNPANWDARRNLAELYRSVPQLTERLEPGFIHCPCCNGNFPSFIAGGPNLRPNACCPGCGSLERHRLLCLYLKTRTNFFTEKLKVLHVAPEKILQDIFKGLPNLDYVSADIASPLAMMKMDITDIPLDDDTFDVIICSHVLEHIPDDRKAMRELHRVLKRDGWAILQVPIDLNRAETYEDPTITDPAERQRLFGQDDHVRWYGIDYAQRLTNEGFAVTVDEYAKTLDLNEAQKMGLVATESIYFCKATGKNDKHTTAWPESTRNLVETVARDYSVAPCIHGKDFIFDFLLSRLPDEQAAVTQYFKRGDYSAAKLADMLHSCATSSDRPLRLLEFAAGYGSITRHFPNHLPASVRVTCCDIHAEAVEFIRDRMGYPAVVSTAIPEQLPIEPGFDVIFALSFFSHMPEKTWSRWLYVLLGKLAPGGSLIFTTHGVSSLLRAKYPLDKFDGFIYRKESEQKDLDTEEYGHTIVSPRFVASSIPRGYHIAAFQEAEWEEHQDLYVILKH